jgi:5'-nucleotidase
MVYGTDGTVQVSVSSSSALTGSVRLLEGATELDDVDLAGDGTATLTVAGTALAVGPHTLGVEYSGDAEHAASQTTLQVTVSKASSTTAATVTPGQVVVGQGTATVHVAVSATGFTPGGTVDVYVDGAKAATGTLTSGQADVVIGPFSSVGSRTVSVKYLGDSRATASESASRTLDVVKATPTMTVTTSPSRITVKDAVAVTASLAAQGQVVSGTVLVSVDGRVLVGSLADGSVTFDLPKFGKAGTYQMTILYGGSTSAYAVSRTVPLEVLKK